MSTPVQKSPRSLNAHLHHFLPALGELLVRTVRRSQYIAGKSS